MDTFIVASPRISETKMVLHSEESKPGRNGKLNGDVWFFIWLKRVVSKAISATTRPETEVGLRPFEAVLGDQESGVSGGWRGVKKSSLPLSKWGRSEVSDGATFSVFAGVDNENVHENRNSLKTSHQIQRLLSYYSTRTLLRDEFSLSTR